MARPLSNDLRDRLVSAVDGGLSRRSAAKHFGVAPSTAIKWVDRWHRTGDVGPRRVDHLHAGHGLTVALSTVWRQVRQSLEPGPAAVQHVRALLLARVRGFF